MRLLTFTIPTISVIALPVTVGLYVPSFAPKVPPPLLSSRQTASCDPIKVAQLSGGIQANLDVQAEELIG
jgi:hypothetical protein